MKYDFNLENFKKIINSDEVPDDEDGLDLDIEGIEVTIWKPYLNDNGEERGNSILVDSDSEIQVFFTVINDNVDDHLFSSYRLGTEGKFILMEENCPQNIKNFANKIWVKIVDEIEELENQEDWESEPLLLEDYLKIFKNHQPPKDLLKLFEFAEKYGHYDYSEEFYLSIINDTGIKTWSEEMEFRNAFIEFAGANGTGSDYGFWLTNEDLNQCPIVIFGDEGGIHIIAENFRALLQLLTYDIEPSVDFEHVYFYSDEDDEDYEHSGNHEDYLDWAQENFGISPITTNEEADEIIETAQEKYKKQLNEFLLSFGIEN